MAAEQTGIKSAEKEKEKKAKPKAKAEAESTEDKVTTKPAPKPPKARASLPGVWGIDLGQCALKAIRVEEVDGEITATAFDYIEHPKILSQPDADPDQLTREALDKFLSRNSLKGDTIVISVPGQSGLARFVKLPPVEEKKISDIVRFEAKQQIPFPLDEVVWDYQKLSAGVVTDGFALETEIGLFAMKRDMVNRYLQHFQDVNVEVHIVQMAPLALCNFVTHDLLSKGGVKKEGEEEDEVDASKKQCIVALDIGADNSNLVITDGAKIIWQRPIPIGGNHFTRALTKDLKLTFAKAEHLKRNAVKSPDLKKILAALRPVLNDFVSEVQRSLGYFTNTHRDANVKYMIGLGNAFRLPGLQKFIQEKLQLEVRKLASFKRLQGESVTTAPQFTENILSFAVAHGLALQGLKQARLHTNLLPAEIRVERVIRAKKPWAAAAAAILLVGLGALALGRYRQHAAWANPAIEKALKEGKENKDLGQRFISEFATEETKAKEAQQAVLRIAAGVPERFNWNQLYQYVNEALPRPDGTHLPKIRGKISGLDPYQFYFKEEKEGDSGEKAWERFGKRRQETAQGAVAPTPESLKQEDDIKKRLVQLNVEGMVTFYTDDLPAFFKTLKDAKNLPGLSPADKAEIVAGDKLPKNGWLVEVRGHTSHEEGSNFVINTLIENLMNPDAAGLPDEAMYAPGRPTEITVAAKDAKLQTLPADEFRSDKPNVFSGTIRERHGEEIVVEGRPRDGKRSLKRFERNAKVKASGADVDSLVTITYEPGQKRIRYAFLYKFKEDKNPQPGIFTEINTSHLRTALGGGAPAARSGDGTVPARPMPMPTGPETGKGGGTETAAAPTGPNRDAWRPIGEIAKQSDVGGSERGPGTGLPPRIVQQTPMPTTDVGGNEPPARLPRYEFVIFFVWLEPLPTEGGQEPSPPR